MPPGIQSPSGPSVNAKGRNKAAKKNPQVDQGFRLLPGSESKTNNAPPNKPYSERLKTKSAPCADHPRTANSPGSSAANTAPASRIDQNGRPKLASRY